MPKIIRNIEENIFNAAFELFGEHGYKETDMKKIAKRAGIAVGTLYNYYSNKRELFVSVFVKSWNNTFLRIDNMINQKINAEEKIKSFIEILYNEISERKGLGEELSKENAFNREDGEKMSFVKEELLNRIQGLLNEFRNDGELKLELDMDERLGFSLIVLIANMIRSYSEEKDKNLKFINQLIESIYKK